MTLKPERIMTESIISFSLLEATANAGAAVKGLNDTQVRLATTNDTRATVVGVLLQDVRPYDYTTRPMRLCDLTAVSGDKVGILTKGVITTEVAGTPVVGGGVGVTTDGALTSVAATVSGLAGLPALLENPLAIGKVLASGEPGFYKVMINC